MGKQIFLNILKEIHKLPQELVRHGGAGGEREGAQDGRGVELRRGENYKNYKINKNYKNNNKNKKKLWIVKKKSWNFLPFLHPTLQEEEEEEEEREAAPWHLITPLTSMAAHTVVDYR